MTNFQPRTGATVYDTEGAALLLSSKIGEGGEGSVWSVENNSQVVAKFYKDGLPPGQTRKLDVMCRLKSDSLLKVAAWPTAMLTSSPLAPVEGLLMRRISGYEAAHLLYSPKSRRASFPEAQFPFILHTTANIARSFAAVHDAGQVIGDVNHGNLLVAKNATVALIDCDSFQITDGPTTFPCLVGVPEYTPPELQGIHSFREIRRTQQHDAFGLAVLIFHMLFLGRDPFAGIPSNGTSDVTIPEAIRNYRFAYLPDHNATHMEPPPSAPRLSEFTPAISELFIRAFTRDGLNGRRPSAHDWIAALETLSKSIKQCTANSSHHFYRDLQFCPWCRVEAIVGIPMFGIKIIVVRDEHFNIAGVWAQIEAIRPALDTQPLPTSMEFFDSCSVDLRVEAVLKRVSGNVIDDEFKAACDRALDNYNAAMEEWTKANQAPAAFLETKKALETAKQEFNDLPALRARKLAELNGKRWPRQLQCFLERYRIDDSHIPGIGAGRKTLLRSYNIEDAYDVEYHALERVKGFGPAMRTILLDWRKGLEREFQFDPNQAVDPIDLQRLEQGLNHKKADLIRSLMSGPQELQRSLLLWQVQRRQIRTKLQDSAQHLAQAQVNMNALRVRLAGPQRPIPASVPPVNVARVVVAPLPLPTPLSQPGFAGPPRPIPASVPPVNVARVVAAPLPLPTLLPQPGSGGPPGPIPASAPPVNVARVVAAPPRLPILLRQPSHPKPNWAWGVVIGALFVLIAVLAFTALKQTGSSTPPNVNTSISISADSIQVGHHRFDAFGTGLGHGFIQIFADGKLEKLITGGSFSIPKASKELPGWHNGSDINGDSIPEVVTREFSGGAHCCTRWHIFSAGPTLREIPIPQGVGGDDVRFPLVDVSHDGNYELRMKDSTFAYWNTSLDQSPGITLFYVWRAGRYAFAPKLVRRPRFSREELERMAQKLSWHKTSWLPDKTNAEFDEVPPEFWADLLDLIGTGNADQVDVFAQIAWPGTKAGKARFLASFRKQLRKSPHMAEFQSLNGAAASKPALKQFVLPKPAVPKPILSVVPTITTPAPQIRAAIDGDPLASTLPFSGGPGSSGFGAGKRGDIGSHNGDGFGPGSDGGTGVRVYHTGGDVSIPQLVSKVEPEYSEQARKANLSGAVLLSIIIDKQGLPRDIRVTRGVGLGLDEKAIEAVSQWRFRPGMKGLERVAVEANIEVSFRMLSK